MSETQKTTNVAGLLVVGHKVLVLQKPMGGSCVELVVLVWTDGAYRARKDDSSELTRNIPAREKLIKDTSMDYTLHN